MKYTGGVNMTLTPMARLSALPLRRWAERLQPPGKPGVTLPFYPAIGCYWLSFPGDLRSNLAAIAVIFCQDDSAASGYPAVVCD